MNTEYRGNLLGTLALRPLLLFHTMIFNIPLSRSTILAVATDVRYMAKERNRYSHPRFTVMKTKDLSLLAPCLG
jgi:hypothetical protein